MPSYTNSILNTATGFNSLYLYFILPILDTLASMPVMTEVIKFKFYSNGLCVISIMYSGQFIA